MYIFIPWFHAIASVDYVCLFLLLLCFLLTKENKVWKQQPLVIQALQAQPGYSTTRAYDRRQTTSPPSKSAREITSADLPTSLDRHGATLQIPCDSAHPVCPGQSRSCECVHVTFTECASMGVRSQTIPSEVQKATQTGRQQFPHDPVEIDDQSQPQTLICFVPRAPENLCYC